MPETNKRGGEYKTSDESSHTQILVAKAEGKGYSAALAYLNKIEASDSGEEQAGDYLIAYAIEDAVGLYYMRDGKLQWEEPEKENCHIEVAVRCAADGRFLPGLSVRATLLDSNGKELGSHPMPFLWHPWIYHYGCNWAVPREGAYRLRLHIDPPEFPRHDIVNGKRFEHPVDVEFPVHIKTGHKISRAA